MLLKATLLFTLFATTLCEDKINQTIEELLDEVFGRVPKTDTGSNGRSATPQGSTLVLPSQDENVPCTTEDKQPGECIKIEYQYLCDPITKSIIDDAKGLIDIRGVISQCSYLEFCCALSDRRPSENTTAPTPQKEEQKEGCGWSNPQGVGGLRITGNTDGETQFGEFPWMVAILMYEPVKGHRHLSQERITYLGGGSLIHSKVVLTTAYHVANVTNLRVRAGEWDTRTTKETYPHQDRDVESKEVHEKFNDGNLHNDVALLFLNKPFDPAPNIGIACLPPPKQVQQERTNCFATGWGKDKFGKIGEYQVILKKVELPIVKVEVCQNRLRKTRVGKHFNLHPSFACAGGVAGKDTCKGDGGSPLVCPIESQPDRYKLVGMVAWGIGCGEDGVPGVYANVSAFREWIDDKMANGYGNEMAYAKY